MDDLNRAPGDGDRKPLRERIAKAVAEGRLSGVDADIRLGNVNSAQSLTELSLIARDLDQLDATFAAAGRSAHAPAGTSAPQYATPVTPASQSSGRLVPLLILGLVFALVVAGGVALFVFSSDGKDERGDAISEVDDLPSVGPSASTKPALPGDPGSEPPASPEAPDGFELSASGVRSFVAQYRQKFGTTRVTDLTMYGDYAVVQVPVPGKKRHQGWLYRDGAWQDFGGISADFPGTAVVDLTRLDVDAMMRNIAKAKRTLEVEDINQNYVVINYRPDFDDAPNVNIYVSNEYHESGYLATTLNGKVERAYPFGG